MLAEILKAPDAADDGPPWSRAEFESRLRDRGRAYHIHHPFNVMLNSGRAQREQIQGWVANRFYYQIAIPIKDAAVLSNCPDREVRRGWVQRILDHDGFEIGDGTNTIRDPGGIEAEGLSYFRNRVSQARRDVDQGLAITLDHFDTRPLQQRALQVLQFKLDILWTMNDAMATRYGVTG